ncbi:MAG: type II secretion system protein GspE, partial [Burkholderiaceae bacterium]|nr:type II secretion system protein GspE [Burkholderiaceae bacterium]
MTPLPYAWARAQRAILTVKPDGALLTYSSRTPAWALAEVQRCYPAAQLHVVPDDEMETLLAAGYAQTGDAAAVMGVAESEIDLDRLMQD